MASLRQLVNTYKEDLMDGIQWVVFWKDGRSWHADTIFTEMDDDNPDPEYNPITLDTKEDLQAIYKRDNKAIILNGYYCSSFYADESLTEWVKHIRYCYESQLENAYQVKRFLELREVVLSKKDEKEITEAAEVLKAVEAEVKETNQNTIEKFLASEAGDHLKKIIRKWDYAIESCDIALNERCIYYWDGAKSLLNFFIGKKYFFNRTEKECGIVDDNGNWLLRIR